MATKKQTPIIPPGGVPTAEPIDGGSIIPDNYSSSSS